jgi:hypothetical protein
MSLNVQSLSQSTFSTFVPDATEASVIKDGPSAEFGGCVPPLSEKEEYELCGVLENQLEEDYLKLFIEYLEKRTSASSIQPNSTRFENLF